MTYNIMQTCRLFPLPILKPRHLKSATVLAMLIYYPE